MRILYLTQWFSPEPMLIKGTEFVRALEAAGHEVHVVTGFPNYPGGKIYPGYRVRPWQHDTIDGVSVMRLPLYPSHDGSAVGRALNYLSFFMSALIYGLVRGRNFDLVYVYHPPITVGLAAALFAPLYRKPFVIEIQDLWPDTVVASGMRGTGRIARVLGVLCDFVYRRATRIIAQSYGMRARLQERGVPAQKLAVVRNWAETASATVSAARPRDAGVPLRLLYAGNLGRVQRLDLVIRAIALARARGVDVEFSMIGGGIETERLKALADEAGDGAVHFLERVSIGELARRIADFDVLLLHLAADPLFTITIPSKTQFYLSTGMPIVAGIDGEAAQILTDSGAAVVVPAEDVERLASAFAILAALPPTALAEMGTKGRAFYDAELSVDRGMEATLAVIAAAGGGLRG